MDEEWVDGSWTVDCVCGVNFDDGKEMVNCDECGVWVHTRCSLYAKGDELFACHNCKSKSNEMDAKEAEIAQLLVEFPTKSLRVENSGGQSLPLSPPFRSCTEIPMEERVHVQGIPGGDLALFDQFSSVFSRQLWKCSGYVPKKFKFKYKEFPWWDEKESTVCENVHKEDSFGGVLCSLSKENGVTDPTSGMKRLDDKETNDYKIGMKDSSSNFGSREMEMKHSQSLLNKDNKSLLRPLITIKRRRELLRVPEDHITKRVKVTEKEEDDKNDSVHKAG